MSSLDHLDRPAAARPDEANVSTQASIHAGEIADASPTPMGESAAERWRLPLVVLAVTLAGLLAMFAETGWSMVDKWWSIGTYGHGFLIAPISVYLAWRRRHVLAAITPSPSLWGVPLLVAAGFGWLLADIAGVTLVKQAALVAMIDLVVLTVLGWRVVRWLLFPLAFLFFSVPAGDFLVPPMQDLTAVLSVEMIRLTGVPVFMDGLLIHIPTGSFIVAEACSGVRFMISTLALGCLGAYFFYTSWWRRLAFLGLAIVVPIIANAGRAYLIVMIAYWTDHELAVGPDHLVYGWFFLSIVTLCLLGLGMLFRQDVQEPGPDAVEADAAPAGSTTGRVIAGGGVALLLLAAFPAYASVIEGREGPAAPEALQPPPIEDPWAPVAGNTTFGGKFPGLDLQLLQTYSDGDRRVQLVAAYVPYQRQGREVVSQHHSFEHAGWLRSHGGKRTIRFQNQDLAVRTVILKSHYSGRLVWYWYWVDGTYTADPLYAKFLETKTKLLGGRQDAALIAVATAFADEPAEAAVALQAFLDDLGSMEAVLDAAAGATEGRS